MKQEQADWKDALNALLPADFQAQSSDDTDVNNTSPSFTQKQKLHVDIERKDRGGKTATIISGFDLPDNEIAEIAAVLKRKLGTGGASRGGEILIQGERRKDATTLLIEMGFKI